MTRFTFDDDVAVNVIGYRLVPGGADGTRRVDLGDVTAFRACFGSEPLSDLREVCDFDTSGKIGLTDFAAFRNGFMGP